MAWILTAPSEPYTFLNGLFNREEVDKIIHLSNIEKFTNSTIGPLHEKNLIRTSEQCWMPPSNETRWIYERLEDPIKYINGKYFEFEITQIEELQFARYTEELLGKYEQHIDMLFNLANTRKISIIIFLSDSKDFTGGELLLHGVGSTPISIEQKPGKVVFFPSYIPHEITPVTKGKRYSLVTWALGPKFK